MDVTTASPAINPAQSTTSAGTALDSDFETFLKMLTAQIQNQDPLNPMQSQEFATQLATFTGVEQQVRTNDLLQGLGVQLGVMGMSQMAAWVGMEARASVPAYFDGNPVTVAPNPAAAADTAQLVVRDENGQEIQRLDIPVSADPVEWAGVDDADLPFADGLYSFEVESFLNGELMATTSAEVYSRITEARGEGGQTILVLEGGVKVPSESVTALREP